jgi:hypothetical protein
MLNKIFLSVFIFLLSLTSFADGVQVQATVDRTEMGVGDTVTLSISVTSSESVEAQEPRVPSLNGFELVNSWNSSSTSSRLVQGNGGMQFQTQRRQDFNYMITPQRAGTLTIPGFEVIVDGKKYETKPIKMQISSQGSGAAQAPPGLPPQVQDEMDEAEQLFNQLLQKRGMPQAPAYRNLPINPNEAFFIQCEVDKTDVYEGEQIVVNWYIYTRGNIMSLDRLKFPDLKGFWKEIIEEVPSLNFTQEVVNGIPYKKALLASHALFPIKPGVAVIDEYKLKAQVALPTSTFGSFGFGKPYTFSKSSERIKINVKPIPTEGKPADFSGAVGQFNVQVLVDGNQFPVNQPFSMRVRFEGSGNAKLIELPHLDLPKGIEIYDTKSDAKFFKNGQSFKEFDVLIIPREEGELTIPAMNFSLFDPKAAKFVTKHTEAIKVKIVANPNGNAGATTPAVGGGSAASVPPVTKKAELPDILVSWNDSQASFLQSNQKTIWGILYLGIFMILGFKVRQEFGLGQARRDLKAELKKRLKKAGALSESGDWRAASAEMTNIIYSILGEVSGTGGANVELSKLLDAAPPSLRREMGAEIAKISDIWQVLSFAPESVVGKLKEKSEMKKNISETEKILLKALALAEDRSDEMVKA